MSLHDGIVLPDQLAVCIDCGETSGRLLPERFPHVCHECLFPPRKENEDPTADYMGADPLELALLARVWLFPIYRSNPGRASDFGHSDPHQHRRDGLRPDS